MNLTSYTGSLLAGRFLNRHTLQCDHCDRRELLVFYEIQFKLRLNFTLENIHRIIIVKKSFKLRPNFTLESNNLRPGQGLVINISTMLNVT